MISLEANISLEPLEDIILHQQTAGVLKALEEEDRRNPRSFENLMFFDGGLSYDRQRRYFQRMLTSGRDALFLVREDPNHAIVGTIGLHEIDRHVRNARIGALIFSASQRGKGIGSTAIRLMLDHGFAKLDLNKVYLNVFAENEKGRRLYSRLGFVEEGTLRQEYLLRGQYHDMVRMSMLRSEWEKLP